MPFNWDSTGIKESGSGNTVPKGIYQLQIKEPKEGQIRNGQNAGKPKVDMKLVVSNGSLKGKWCFHTVSFLNEDAPGAGFAKHFLKVLGQPFDGKVRVSPSSWDGIVFLGRLDYKVSEKDGKRYVNNTLAESWAKDDLDAPECVCIDAVVPTADMLDAPKNQGRPRAQTADTEEVPF